MEEFERDRDDWRTMVRKLWTIRKLAKRAGLLLLAFTILLLQGCALTSLVRDQTLDVTGGAYDQSVAFRCHGRMVSMMLFPVVPMPPVIPWQSKGSEAEIVLRSLEDAERIVGISIVGADGGAQPQRILSLDRLKRGEAFGVGQTCGQLDGQLLELAYRDSRARLTRERFRLSLDESLPTLRLVYFVSP